MKAVSPPRPKALEALNVLSQAAQHVRLGDPLDAAAVPFAQQQPALARRLGFDEGASGEWKLSRQPRWRVAWLSRSDQAAWHALFRASFGHDMPSELFDWKYRDANPVGVGVWSGDALVAFYGGMPRTIAFCGENATAVQIGDVMVEPSQRGVLTRSGPFQMAAATYLELCIGYDSPHLLGFGFPSGKAFRVANRQGLYDAVDHMVALHWSAQAAPLPWNMTVQPLTANDAKKIDALWNGMRAALTGSIVGVRDAHYVLQRYLLHPDKPYVCLLVRNRFSRTAVGLVVLRDRGQEGVELVDVVARPEKFGLLVQLARAETARLGRHDLNAWITESHAAMLATPDATRGVLDITIPSNRWSPGPSRTEPARQVVVNGW